MGRQIVRADGGGHGEVDRSTADWHRAVLLRPPQLLLVPTILVIAALVAQITSCNVHELGHAVVASALGWEVERIDLCLPDGGAVHYGSIPRWAGNAQGYAGGILAAGYLLLVHWLAIDRPRRPLRRPEWWAAGLGGAPLVGPQLVVAVLEGAAGPGEDYTDAFADHPLVLVPLMVVAALAGIGLYLWRWRAVWRPPAGGGVSPPRG